MNVSTYFNYTGNFSWLQRECVGDAYFTAECLHKNFCPQFKNYYINTGIFVILLYMLGGWLSWWFFSHGYKKVDFINNEEFQKYFGDWNIFENRLQWDSRIHRCLSAFLLGFSVIVILLNI